MDEFGVPKKINRHVLKALYYKNELGYEYTGFSEICDLVENSMKNTVPVRDLPGAVHRSLQNMATLGVIGKNGSKFYVPNFKPTVLTPKRVNPRLFGINGYREEKSILDPNLKRHHGSDESLSGSDRSRVLKRFRPVKNLIRRGYGVTLPKARRSPTLFNLNVDYEQEGSPNDESCNNDEEDETGSNSSLNTVLKKQLFSQISEMDQSLEQNDQKQSTNDEPSAEEKKCNNVEDRPLTPKIESTSKEVLTTEQKTDEIPKESPKSSNDP